MTDGPTAPRSEPQGPDTRPAADSQDEALAFLTQGVSYGDASATVERIDTHCSVIFLVGERAFKMKRAVVFSYLDYGTLARRRRFCEAELALGRRLAPAMYRGLHAVTRDASGGLALDGGTGTPVEFLVEMRRFDEADLFDKLAKAGRLTPALMRDLADGIAEFHATSEPTPSHGGSAAIRAVIDDCRDNLRRASGIFEIERVDALHAASLAAWQGAATLLDRRRADGKVRRCHGDLHLRNICLLDGKPTLFDGIEFSDDIADIDVLYDLAFLLMDLRHREHDDLGNLVFNRYLDRTDDTGGLAALPLFLSIRAAIRAHVTAASAPQQSDSAAAAEQARSYLALARDLLRPRQPSLIAIGGVSGTGKSSLARAVAPALGPVPGARMVHTDIIRKRLAGVAPETRLPPGAYSREMNDRVYGALYAEATEALRAGYAVIVDAVSLLPAERAATAEIARSVGVSFTGIWLEAPPELLAERIAARTGDASDATVDVLHLQLGHNPGPIEWHRLDAAKGIADLAAAARSILAASA